MIIATAAAPACWPKIARATREQLPRTVTTSLPVTPAAVYSAGSQPSETPPEPVPLISGSTITGSEVPLAAVMPLASSAVMPPVGVSASASPGYEACESIAATLIAFSPVLGLPATYGTVPEFPLEATTTMPAFTAFSDASASASSSVPKSAPSDMLITCMSCATAQSIASTTNLVPPVQPNTRTAYRSASGATPGPMLSD